MPTIPALRFAVAALALTGMLGLAACSGPAKSADPTSVFTDGALSGGGSTPKAGVTTKPKAAGIDLSKIDPCSLFTQSDAETMVKTTLSPGQDVKDPTQPSCTYQPDPNGPTAQATLNIGAGALNVFNIDKNIGHTFTDVPGIGDEAHLEPGGIFFRIGTTWASLTMVRLDDAEQYNQNLIDAATKVAGGLKAL